MDTQSFDFLQIAVGLAAIGSFVTALLALPVSRRVAVLAILLAVAALTAFFSLAGPSMTAGLFHLRGLWPQMVIVVLTGLLFGLWAHQISRLLIILIVAGCAVALAYVAGAFTVHSEGHQMDFLKAAVTFYMAELRPLMMRIVAGRLELLAGLIGLAGGILTDHLLPRLDNRTGNLDL